MAPDTRSNKAGKSKDGKDPPPTEHAIEPGSGKKRTARLPAPSTSHSHVKDPSADANWKNVEPQSQEEMNDWLEREKALILHFLQYCKSKAEDSKKRSQKESHEQALFDEWARWEPETDIQTGSIYDPKREDAMLQSMASVYKKSRKEYAASGDFNSWHDQYRHAQILWEDFLYYQNAWNRPRSNDPSNPRGPHTDFNPNVKSKRRTAEEKGYVAWRENMIRLYNKWDVGDRSKIPEKGIGPDQLHMYPDNIRHTSKSRLRLPHLQEQFPLSTLRLDDAAIDAKRTQINLTRKQKSPTAKPLPTYHSTTEHTTPFPHRIPTSWESSTWPAPIASKIRRISPIPLPRPIYKTHTIPHLVREYTTLLNEHDKRVRDEENGGWVEGWVDHMVDVEEFELDEEDRRVVRGEDGAWGRPVYVPDGSVREAHEKRGEVGRRERYKEALVKDGGDLLSDGEEEGDVEMLDAEGLSGDSEGDEDDEGDKFTEAYREGSGLKRKKRDDGSGGTPSGSDDSGSSGDDESSDDDDEGDKFTEAYRNGSGLPVREKGSSTPEDGEGSGLGGPPGGGYDGPGDGSSSKSPSPPPGGSPSGGDGSSGKGGGSGKGLGDTDGKDKGDGDDDNSDDGPPPGSSKPTKKRRGKKTKTPKQTVDTESFEEDPKNNCRYVNSTHRYPSGFEYTQRDRVPAVNLDAPELLDSKGKPVLKVYPENPIIPVERTDKYKKKAWKKGKDGIFYKDNLKWRPTMVMRKFREDTGEYYGSSQPWTHFDKLIEQNLPHDLVDKFNKFARQYVGRNDDAYQKNTETKDRWTTEEVEAVVQFLNGVIDEHGLVYLVDNWDEITRQARDVVGKYRRDKSLGPRGQESMRTKFSRGAGVQRKLEELRKRGKTILEAELRPRDFFTVEDFARAKAGGKGKTAVVAKSKKRNAKGKAKMKSMTEEDFESEGESEEDEDESDFEGESNDEAAGSGEPSRKKRKR